MGDSLYAPDADQEAVGAAPGLGTAPLPLDTPAPASDGLVATPDPGAYQAVQEASSAPAGPWQVFQSRPSGPWEAFGQPARADTPQTATPFQGADAPGFDVPDPHQTIESFRKIGNAFVSGLGDGWTGGQIVPTDHWGLPAKWSDDLRQWTSYQGVEKADQTTWQAFNEAFVFPAVRGLAEAAAIQTQASIAYVQPLLQVGSAGLKGVTEAIAQTGTELGTTQLGRDIAGMVELRAMGRGENMGQFVHGPREVAPTDRGPIPQEHPAVTAFRQEPFPEARVPITPEVIEIAKDQGVLGTQAEWDGTSVYSSARPDEIVNTPMDIHGIARQIDPNIFEEYDRLRAVHDLALQEFRDETARASQEVAESAPHTAEIADIERLLQDPDITPKRELRLQTRIGPLREERDAYLANHDLPGLVLASPENMALRNFIADNAARMADLEPRVSDLYAEASRRLPEPEIRPAAQEAMAEPVAAAAAPPRAAPEVTQNAPPVTQNIVDVAQHVTERLKAAGRPEDEASAVGTLVNAYFETRAAREGGTASDLYQRSGLTIAGRDRLQRNASGSLSEVNGRTILTLAAKADASTALHEFGHMWTRQLLRDAATDGAADAVKADAATVRNWLGVPEGVDLSRNQHERMARAFETYMREGSAPTASLARVFAQFKDWLQRVYEGLKDKGVPLNDDIRGVFDRWFSSNPERATIAPEQSGPPRVRTMAEIMREDSLSPAKAQARNFEEIIALADWQAVNREAVEAAKMGRAPPPAPSAPVAHTEAERPVAEATPSEAPVPNIESPVATSQGEPERLPGVAQNFGPEAKPPPLKAYQPLPKEPKRLIQFLKESVVSSPGTIHETRSPGGLNDAGGDVSAIIGGAKGRPGLLNRTGQSLDDAALRAWENGYLIGDKRPMVNDLLEAIDRDHNGRPVYSQNADADIHAYEQAVAHNREIDRMAAESGVDPRGMNLDDFMKAVEEKLSPEEFDREEITQRARSIDAGNELRDDLMDWSPAEAEEVDGIPLEDLDRAWREADASQELDARQEGGGEPGISGGREGQGPENRGGIGARAGDAGQASEGGEATSANGSGTSEPTAKPEPLPVSEPTAALAELKQRRRDEIPKIANVRLEYIDQERWDDLAREVAGQLSLSGDPRVTEGSVRALSLHAINNAALDGWDQARQGWQKAPTPDNLIEMERAKGRAAAAFENLSAGLTDWGKTGNQWQAIIKASKRRIADIEAGLPDSMTLFQRQTELDLLDKLDNPDQVGKALRDDYLSTWDKTKNGLLAYYLSNILSGPVTHLGYLNGGILGNVVHGLITVPLQATYGALRTAITGSEMMDRVMFGEAPAHIYGLMNGAMKAVAPAIRALKTGETFMEGQPGKITPYDQQILPNLMGGWAGYVLETPLRAIRAIHVLNYSMRFQAEVSRLAYRTAARELEGKDTTYSEFGASMQRYLNNIPEEDMAYAHDEAIRSALMKPPAAGSLQSKISGTLQQYPGLRIIAPFPQIGMNLAEEGLIRNTPLGVFNKGVRAELGGSLGGAHVDIAAGRMMAGTGIAAGVIGLTLNGMITGSGPNKSTQEGRDRARVLEAQGWAPYSLRWGNSYIPLRKGLGPLGELIGMSATLAESGKAMGAGEQAEAAARLAHGFGQVVMDETWLRGVHDVFEAATHPDDNLGYYLTNIATNLIPLSQFNSQIARQIDPDMRAAKTTIERFENKIPVISEGLHPVIGPWGQPVLSHSSMGPHAYQNDPVSQRLIDLGMGVKGFEHKIKTVEMDPAEYEHYGRMAGTLAHQLLLPMVTAQGFSDLPRGMQMKQIDQRISLARSQAEKVIQASNFEKFIVGAINAKQKMLIQGRGSAAP